MRHSMISAAAALVLLLASAAVALAQSPLVQPSAAGTAYADRIERLEAELADLRTSLDAGRFNGTSEFDASGICDSCCCEQRTSGFYGGAAALLMKPHFKEAYQASTVDGLTSTMALIPFEFDYNVNFRGWLGYQNMNGIGARVTYSNFGQSSAPLTLTQTNLTSRHQAQVVTINIPAVISTVAPGDTLSVNSSLDTQIVDFDGTRQLTLMGIDIVASGGLRYAKLDQNFNSAITGVFPQTLTWQRTFEGLGPSVGGDARLPLGRGFSVVGSGRGSLMFGQKTMTRNVSVVAPGLPQTTNNVQLIDADEVTPIFSAGLGAQWDRQLANRRLFLKAMYEGALWAEAGAPTLGYLGFQGFAFSAGIEH